MIKWRQLLNVVNKPFPDYWEGFVGEQKVAIVHKVAKPNWESWKGEFFPDRAHFFRDTLEQVEDAAEDYWKEFLAKTGLEAAEERMWH
jgi:hypothetical protein